MQPLKKQKYFYYLAFLLMASTFLPIVFNNLPRFIGSHHLWTIIWVISLFIFNPKIFSSRTMIFVLAYGLFLFLATETIWNNIDDWNYKMLFNEFYQISIGISVFTYFSQSRDYLSLAKITRWSLIFLFITAIMSIISSIIDPLYARNLTGLAAVTNESEIEAILSVNRYGGGTYSTDTAFMCLFPVLIYYYKNIRVSIISKKQTIIISVIFFLALLGMQILGNILIAVVFFIIALLGIRKIKQSVLAIVLFLFIVMIIPKNVYVNALVSVGNYFEKGSELNFKFKDLALFIETGSDTNENTTGTSERVARYPMLMETFTKSPLLGCYFLSDETGNGYNLEGGHLYWMNKLTTTGIMGLIFFLSILFNFIKRNIRYFDSSFKFNYYLSSLAILSYGIIKVIAGREAWYTFFIILPGLYFLPLLKKSSIKTNVSGNEILISKNIPQETHLIAP